MSHFACADDFEHLMNQKQVQTFHQFVEQLPGPKSFANSAAVFQFPQAHYNVVRPGLSLYGISSVRNKTASQLHLKPVMTLQTRLIAIRQFSQGSCIGYESNYTCPENMPVGVVAMGYGDGYSRSARNGTPVLVNGIRCPLVGRVSMDMMSVDLRNCSTAKVGDPVILWGDQLPLEEVAAYTTGSPYDLVTGVQQRVKFYWTLAGREDQVHPSGENAL